MLVKRWLVGLPLKTAQAADEQQAEQDAHAAIDQLKRATGLLLFEDTSDIRHLDEDGDLAPLRGRPAYRAWRETLNGG